MIEKNKLISERLNIMIIEPFHKQLGKIHIGCEKPRSYFIPYQSAALAKKADSTKSAYFKTLCGEWNFRFFDSFEKINGDLISIDENVGVGEDRISVPSNWQMYLDKGYDVPQYTNIRYPFPKDPPHIPDDNPCGLYTREFSVTENFCERELYLNFEGVDSCFYVFINGQFVGFSTVSHSTSEFAVSKFIKPGKNRIQVLVVKWCAESYIEDQDMWRMSGIFREVYLLARAKEHIRDVFVKGELSESLDKAVFKIDAEISGGKDFSYMLVSPDGEGIDEGECDGKAEIGVDNPTLWSCEARAL